MPKPIAKGEYTLTVGGVPLDLQYKTRNLRVLTEILGGKSPFELLMKVAGMDMESDPEQAAMTFADPHMLVALLAAGVSHAPEFSRESLPGLIKRLEDLLDIEVAQDGNMIGTYSRIGAQVLLPFLATLSGEQGAKGEKLGKLRAELAEAFSDAQSNSTGES